MDATVDSRSMVHPYIGVLPGPPTRLVPNPVEAERTLLMSTATMLRQLLTIAANARIQ